MTRHKGQDLENRTSESPVPETLRVPEDQAGLRLDRFLAAALATPRNQLQRWIALGLVQVDGKVAEKPSLSLAGGEKIQVRPPPPQDPRIQGEAGELTILYEDEHLVVLDKPAGLVVHPGAGHGRGTLAHRLLNRYPEMAAVGGPGRPGIVHRLDRGTSGVLVAARQPQAYLALSRAFAKRQVGKLYLAVAYGRFRSPAGEIDAPIGRHPQRRQEMTVRPKGRPALTRYRTLAEAEGTTLVRLDIATGRTHQIRVHLKDIGHPLVGDPTYGEKRWKGLSKRVQTLLEKFSRPALHAWRLSLTHPATGQALTFEAPPPEDLVELWRELSGSSLPLEE
jgi:23S rRNA pseudouridine1911/1915/1917 synthase